jgi:hypothetical protein
VTAENEHFVRLKLDRRCFQEHGGHRRSLERGPRFQVPGSTFSEDAYLNAYETEVKYLLGFGRHRLHGCNAGKVQIFRKNISIFRVKNKPGKKPDKVSLASNSMHIKERPTFLLNMSPPSSGLNNQPSNRPADIDGKSI